MMKIREGFAIQGLTEKRAKGFLENLQNDDILYPLLQRAQRTTPPFENSIKVVEAIVYTVYANASSWNKRAAEYVSTGINFSTDLLRNVRNYQDCTNLQIISSTAKLSTQVHDAIQRTLKEFDTNPADVRSSVMTQTILASDKVEADISSQPAFTDMSSQLMQVSFTKISLANNALFKICKTITHLFDLTSLNLKNTCLLELPSSLTLSKLTELDLSDNPELKNIDSIKQLSALMKLDISGTGLKALPDWLWTVQQPLTVTISEDMKKLIPAGQKKPENLTLVTPDKKEITFEQLGKPIEGPSDTPTPTPPPSGQTPNTPATDPDKTLKSTAGPSGTLTPLPPAQPPKIPEKTSTPKAPDDDKKTPIWRSILKWTGIAAICAGVVGLIAWAWNKFRA